MTIIIRQKIILQRILKNKSLIRNAFKNQLKSIFQTNCFLSEYKG
jgi:hypothetical protein